eukprot:gene31843-25629_t
MTHQLGGPECPETKNGYNDGAVGRPCSPESPNDVQDGYEAMSHAKKGY